MGKNFYYINVSNFSKLISKLMLSSTVIAPIKSQNKKYLEVINSDNVLEIDLFGYRTVDVLKTFFFKTSEKVSDYFTGSNEKEAKTLTIIGARECDLEALSVAEKVLLEGEFIDPFYAQNREKALIIGTDCTDIGSTCFCTMVKGNPYPTNHFDINLSPVKGGFVVEVNTDKGQHLIDDNTDLFNSADSIQIDDRDTNRREVVKMLDKSNSKFFLKHEISGSHKANTHNKIWKLLTKDCVECSSCNFICPSCTCFLLLDEKKGEDCSRCKVWDACLKTSYAKVAGGSNPRGKLYERLQNRYHCKFDYSFDRLGRYACVGCGRCIDGCAGNIDMRKIFVELERQAPLTAELME